MKIDFANTVPCFIMGLQIIQAHYAPDRIDLGAEHDVIYVYVPVDDKPFSDSVLGKLDELGFYVPDAESGESIAFFV